MIRNTGSIFHFLFFNFIKAHCNPNCNITFTGSSTAPAPETAADTTAPFEFSLESCFAEVLSQHIPEGVVKSKSMMPAATLVLTKAQIEHEMALYFNESSEHIKTDRLAYWRSRQSQFPALALTARKHLAAPASSVYSERLFSKQGNIYDKKRSRLRPGISEKLLFLHHNLPRVQNRGRKPATELSLITSY